MSGHSLCSFVASRIHGQIYYLLRYLWLHSFTHSFTYCVILAFFYFRFRFDFFRCCSCSYWCCCCCFSFGRTKWTNILQLFASVVDHKNQWSSKVSMKVNALGARVSHTINWCSFVQMFVNSTTINQNIKWFWIRCMRFTCPSHWSKQLAEVTTLPPPLPPPK